MKISIVFTFGLGKVYSEGHLSTAATNQEEDHKIKGQQYYQSDE